MLQRAASNAYSWWWASHIRTKQSKWLEQNLQDMEDKVNSTLEIINDEGDSFAQRAEMYYRKRPELVNFVEEAFRAYRALAERYDHLSKELQSANRTIATVFPDQVQYPVDEDDEDFDDRSVSSSSDFNTSPDISSAHRPTIPKVPKNPKKYCRSPSMLLSRKGPLKRIASSSRPITPPCSGLTKEQALEEMDKLQKEILSLQTEKEFVRSVYERAYEKYWEIENQITGMQKRISSFQNEFGIGTVIEDHEARTLMAATALKSCQETLAKLQEIVAQSSEEAKIEFERIKEAHRKYEILRDEFISKHVNNQGLSEEKKLDIIGSGSTGLDPETPHMEEKEEEHQRREEDSESMREKFKEKLEGNSQSSISVSELADKIDELVNKVVSLETAASSQTALVTRLRSETDHLQTHVQTLEEDKEMLIENSDNMKKKLHELEEELRKVKSLNHSFQRQNNSLQTHFTEASCNLEHLSGQLQNVKPENEVEEDELKSVHDGEYSSTWKKEEHTPNSIDSKYEDALKGHKEYVPEILNYKLGNESPEPVTGEKEDQENWRDMYVSGLDEREKTLVDEYTSVLRDYKDVRAKLGEAEKRNRDSIYEMTLQIRELKNALASKDREIQLLHQKMHGPETNPNESPCTTMTEYKYTPHEGFGQGTPETANMLGPNTPNRDSEAIETYLNSKMSLIKEDLNKIKADAAKLDNSHSLSTMERKFRSNIDDLLEENLEFWLRFSTSVHQIQKFQNSVKDLHSELMKIKDKMRPEGSSKHASSISDARAIYKHLLEIKTELSLWLEHNAVFQDELQGRFSSLCNIQDEISRVSNASASEEKAELREYQAAKFQGEVLNMKQENKKVENELRAGLSLVAELKSQVEKILTRMEQEFAINSRPQIKHSTSRARIPLRSFLFGVKLKKQKPPSIFSCVNPAYQKQYFGDPEKLPMEKP